MSKDAVSSVKICTKCGQEIKKGESYISIAEDFEVGKDSTVDLLTKSYQWSHCHSTTLPSAVKTVCRQKIKPVGKGEV